MQLLRGASDSDLKKYSLSRDAKTYHYTNQGSTEVLTEQSDYKVTCSAFRTLGFSGDELDTVWKVTAAVLQLGNITYRSEDDNLTISNHAVVSHTAKLLDVTEDEMMAALTQRVIAAHGEILKKGHNVEQAEYGRDALAKAIYDRLFTWIVTRINKAILVPGTPKQNQWNKVIGVLDIYGFEIFESNSFEQFCINYCNEKLQQLFIGEFELFAACCARQDLMLKSSSN